MNIRSVLKSTFARLKAEFLAATAGRPAVTTADSLLRDVLSAGFWSNDGVCHYCGKFDGDYRVHHSSCTAKALTAWAVASGIELEDHGNIFPDPLPVSEESLVYPPFVAVPMTPEEVAQAVERQRLMAEGLVKLKDMFNRHLAGDSTSLDPIALPSQSGTYIGEFPPNVDGLRDLTRPPTPIEPRPPGEPLLDADSAPTP